MVSTPKDEFIDEIMQEPSGLSYTRIQGFVWRGPMKTDKQAVLLAIRKYPRLMPWNSKKIRSDKQIVSIAVAKHGHVFQYASQQLR